MFVWQFSPACNKKIVRVSSQELGHSVILQYGVYRRGKSQDISRHNGLATPSTVLL